MATSEIRSSFEWNGLRLAGTFHLPSGPGPHPAVVMLQGSGAADRESGGYFTPIRRLFVDRGVAAFSFDKPGCGESEGDWRGHGLAGRAEQALAAIDVVRSHGSIDGGQVGVWGHSQGGWLVQMLAGGPTELAFAIASSAPSIRVAEQILFECERAMQESGFDEEDVRGACDLAAALIDAAFEGADFDEITDRLLEPARSKPWFGSFPSIVDAGDWAHETRLVTEPFEPLDALRRVTCPFLAVYGGLDVLLPPWRGAEESGRALAEAPSADVSVVAFPAGDHRMHKPGTNEFVDGYFSLLGDWIARRTRP